MTQAEQITMLQIALQKIVDSAPLFADESTDWKAEHEKVRDYAAFILGKQS